jgi:hypothetical protein
MRDGAVVFAGRVERGVIQSELGSFGVASTNLTFEECKPGPGFLAGAPRFAAQIILLISRFAWGLLV